MSNHHHVIIVGAGPGGIAVGAALQDQGISDLVLLEKGTVGQAWLDYPDDTHLLSESTPEHDDNMIAGVPTSAVFPNIPHPSHIMYQKYLEHIVQVKGLEVINDTTVEKVIFDHMHQVFILCTREGIEYTCSHLVWAAGIFTKPNEEMDMEGSYIHYARIPYLGSITSPEVTVVGSANGASGVVMQLAKPDRRITLVTSREYVVPEPIDCLWKENMKFVQKLQKQGLVKIVENFRVKRMYKQENQYILESEDGMTLTAPQKPIICTGFLAQIEAVKNFVGRCTKEHEAMLELDESHQSLKQPGLYFAGAIGKTTHEEGFIRGFRNYALTIAQTIASQTTTASGSTPQTDS